MYLSKLDILGFKSFAQKTNLNFTNGVAAIVGPNGAGKSNIVDAIRWVLGEQKTTVLRSDTMDNVIFNGTTTRKPVGMAEVSLTIENNKNILPSEYTEVVVTRRLFRSGESEYLLNNVKCRLRDIVELFMDTGLGSDSYSVIELKMVEAILSGKAEDRRSLFEEAAGIKKYKIQRKEAIKKLNDTLNDLTRVNDLVEEVRKNVNSLQRHAQKTRRYNILNEELKTIDTTLSVFQFNNYSQINNLLNNEIVIINNEKLKIEENLNSTNLEVKGLRNTEHILENEHNSFVEQEVTTEKDIAQNMKNVAISKERLLRINDDEKRLNDDIININERLLHNANEIQKNQEKIINLDTEIKDNEQKQNVANIKVENAKNDTTNTRYEVTSINHKIQELRTSISSNKNNINRNNDKIIQLQDKIQTFTNDQENLQVQIDKIINELANSGNVINSYKIKLNEKELELKNKQENLRELQLKLDSIREEISKISNEKNQKQSSYNFLQNLIDTSDTTKFLSNNKEWGSDVLMLSECLAVDEHLQYAISIIFDNYPDYYITKTLSDANTAIDLLISNNKGKAGFLYLNDNINYNKLDVPEGTLGWFADLVRCDENIKDAVHLLFEGLIVVNSIENNSIDDIKILFDNQNIKAIASLNGKFLHRAGVISGGISKKDDTIRFGKLEKMNNLQKEINHIVEKLKNIESEKQSIVQQIESINLIEINNNIKIIENDKRNFENQVANMNLKRIQLQNGFDLNVQNCKIYQNDINEIKNEIEQTIENNIKLQNELESINSEFELKHNKLSELEKKQVQVQQTAHDVEIDGVQLKGELNIANNDIKRLTQQQQNYKNNVENKKIELIKNSELRNELNSNIEMIDGTIKKLNFTLDELKNKIDFILQNRKKLQEQIEQNEQQLNDIRREFENIVTTLHQKEVKQSETNIWMKNIEQIFFDNYGTNIGEYSITIDEDYNELEAKNHILEIKQKLQNLGNINFAAIQEYEEEKERLEFLERQIADLLNAEKTLRESIDEINQTAERVFLNTFSKIRINFQNIFKKLFSEEAEADAICDENNPLESEIHITAKPPNKRPNSIEQLSGGEKTLTAIALLFAIYEVKPSPFCILDEVDAPLDDNNVRRFLNIIREFSNSTQFLIVTHNKTTMSAADTLYGVTMQEPGVSKTASVRIDEIE